jgi:hypothetical protein
MPRLTYPTKPLERDDVIAGRALHNDCGGRIEREGVNEHGTCTLFRCSTCRRWWNRPAVNRFTLAELAERFHMRDWSSAWSTHAMVWQVDPVTKTRHVACVPIHEAAGLERFKP